MRRLILSILSIMIIVTLTSCNTTVSFDKSKIDSDFIVKNNDFAFDVFKSINKEDIDKNIFISPFSISTALSMTYQGAEGSTKEGMESALRYKGIEKEVINESYSNLLNYLNDADKKVKLDINNSIWIRKDESIKEDFLDINKEVFNAYVTELDFSKDEASDEINNWIDKSTKGKIKKMIEPPISQNTIMYLINAIYFKGDWTKQFDKNNTFTTKFNNNDSTKDIDMMNKKDDVEYGEGEDYKVVRLPYGSGKTSMYCILPNENISIDEYINEMNIDKFNSIKSSISERKDVILQIPRFKIEYGIKNLNDTLTSLGMEEAFSANADFSGIREGINISRVLHKAVIEVNEEGSEAAGVTVVEMKESAVENPITFIANRPFLFLIIDDEFDTILFMGKLIEP